LFYGCQGAYKNDFFESLYLILPAYKKVYDFLCEMDRENAFHVFPRNPEIFIIWCDMIEPLDILAINSSDGSCHETNHFINSQLFQCRPAYYFKYLFFGNVYNTDITYENTAHISIVEETIPDSLKSAGRYTVYIENSKTSDNNLGTLLDELNSYTGGANFYFQYLNSGLLPEINGTNTSDGELNGMINFMAFLQYYLKSTRLNHPNIYENIKNQQNTLAYIQVLWSKAEEMWALNYPYTIFSGTDSDYNGNM